MSNYRMVVNSYGQKIWVDEKDRIGSTIIKNGIYDRYAVHFLVSILQQLHNPVCLDIGANIGNHALVMSKYSHKIFCFEPGPESAELLLKSADANGICNLQLFQVGLSDRHEMMTLYKNLDGNKGASTLVESLKCENSNPETVEVVVGDEWLAKHHVSQVDFIKIDVEGFEGQALLGLKQTIQASKPIILMEWNNDTTKHAFKQHNLFAELFNDYVIKSVTHTHHKKYWGKSFWRVVMRWVCKPFIPKKAALGDFDSQEIYSNILLIPQEKARKLALV